MFSKPIEYLRKNTALNLTLRFALLFLLCASALFFTASYLLAQAQLQKDQQQISSFLESYQRLEQQAGLHKLELVIERDAPYFQRSAMRVELLDVAGKRLMLVQPDPWAYRVPVRVADIGERQWRELDLVENGPRMLFSQVSLSDGVRLSIGKSVASREAELAGYRTIVLAVMLPLLGLGLLLTAYMNWRALRPVHDLIGTVRALRATDLQARVLVRNPGSELGELAQLFNTMLSQIERLITGMQHSLDAVGHDLRTPLARMRLSLESALSQNDVEKMREALLDCAEESERIETMLRTLMDISEAESGILTLHTEPVDLDQLISECIDLYSYLAEDKGIRLNRDHVEPVVLGADPVRLRQVLCNLLDNAIKYSDHGGRVTVGCQRRDDRVELRVCDQGVGIPAEEQRRVFERLYRVDPSRGEPGMGLGLSLVKAVVEAHRGSIELTSAAGQGCQVAVRLPSVTAAN